MGNSHTTSFVQVLTLTIQKVGHQIDKDRSSDRHLTPWLENREKLNDISTRALSDLPVPLNIGIVQYELEFRYLDRV